MTSDAQVFELFNEIGIIDQLAQTLLANALPRGMTPAQFTVLNHFVRLAVTEKSPTDLARAFQVTRPTMTSTLARMDRAGLIQMRADPADGRAKLVTMTDQGRAMRERCITAIAPLLPMLSTFITADELVLALPILRKIRLGLDAQRN